MIKFIKFIVAAIVAAVTFPVIYVGVKLGIWVEPPTYTKDGEVDYHVIL